MRWPDVDLEAGVFTVRRSFAKGRLKQYAKTARSRRRIPLRAKVIDALNELPRREGILFPAAEGAGSTSTTPGPTSGCRPSRLRA